MRIIRQIPLAICATLVACGAETTGEKSTVGGSGGNGAAGTTTGGMTITPGISDSGQPDLGVGVDTGSGTGLPDEGCDGIACGVIPMVDASTDTSIVIPPEGPPETLSNYGYAWKSSWFIRGCSNRVGYECIGTAACPNVNAPKFEDRGWVVTELFPIGGSVGTTYAVTFQVNGISEAKYYEGGTRDAGDIIPMNVDSADLDMFYRGGTPSANSNYGVLRMRILDPSKKEIARYYLNSAPANSGMESHRTFHLSYSKIIDAPGGGFAEYLTQDSNCHSIDNCNDGDVSPAQCVAPRGIPHEEDNPLPPWGPDPTTGKAVPLATLNSINGATKPWHSQIVHLTITQMLAK